MSHGKRIVPVLLVLYSIVLVERHVVAFVPVPRLCFGTVSNAVAAHSNNRDNGPPLHEPDLFEYFDPLLSPHAYPDGIGPDKKPQPISPTIGSSHQNVNTFGIDHLGESNKPHAGKSHYVISVPNENINIDVVEASSATKNSGVNPSIPAKLGILLMDHGSKNRASNERLEQLAEIYQQMMTRTPNNNLSVVVEAAHMEIARPSIPEGLEALLKANVDEIVCHPYFLSPGRHVVEDIPNIVNKAVKDLHIDIPVTTTDPVGSNIQLMIGAIHALVRESSNVLRKHRS